MIKIHKVILKALCDACGARLSHESQANSDGTPSATHYGELNNHFGYGSPLDGIDNALGRLHLCEACYLKAFKALNLPTSQWEVPWSLQVRSEAFETADDKPFDNEKDDRRGAYYAPVWVCKFCDWWSAGHGYSIPEHRCENIDLLLDAQKSCAICTNSLLEDGRPVYSEPLYSDCKDAWVHRKINDFVPCEASPIMLELMRKGERIDPEWKAKLDATERAP